MKNSIWILLLILGFLACNDDDVDLSEGRTAARPEAVDFVVPYSFFCLNR